MWDEQDHTARWLQGICGVLLAIFALAAAWLAWKSTFFMFTIGGFAAFAGSVRLSWRCLRYAFTGRNNVNRDDF